MAYVDASALLRLALGQPDPIHLATALLWKESEDTELVMATHGRALAIAARARGLMAIGIEE